MPAFDKTGPLGKGPMTGRGLGSCLLTEKEFNQNWAKRFGEPYGRGFGRGFRTGRGMGRCRGMERW